MKKNAPDQKTQSAQQSKLNNNTKSTIYTQERCFICTQTPCIEFELKDGLVRIVLCYKHASQLVQDGLGMFKGGAK